MIYVHIVNERLTAGFFELILRARKDRNQEECRLPAWALPAGGSRPRFGETARSCAQLVRRWGLEKAASLLAKAAKCYIPG